MLVLSIPADGSVILAVSTEDDARTIGLISIEEESSVVTMLGPNWEVDVSTDLSVGIHYTTFTFSTGGLDKEMSIEVSKSNRMGYPGYLLKIDAPDDLIISRCRRNHEDSDRD